MYLYDPEAGSEAALVAVYSFDGFRADLEFGAFAYTRRDDAPGVYLRPLPP